MGNAVLWILVSITSLVTDLVTSSFFFAGFTVGGIFALIALILGYGILVQVAAFMAVSAISIAAEFLWFRKKMKRSIPKTLRMEEEYIGRQITLDEEINERGRVKIDGIYWTVLNEGEPVKKGDSAEIVGIRGNKIIIKK